jgi:hypothetical protein
MSISTASLCCLLALASAPAIAHEGDRAVANAAMLVETAASGHRLILLGELHGTREIPEFVGRLVGDYAQHGPVVLGLEVPVSEQTAIEGFLSSNGDKLAREALLSNTFWRRNDVQHDGRRNYDILDLIERLREMRASGRAVEILAYDNPDGSHVTSEKRDSDMATRIRDAFGKTPRTFLVLSGNVHAMLRRPADAPQEMQAPMGSHLVDLSPFSVDITARSGESWICLERCQAASIPRLDAASGPLKDDSYNFLVVLPRFSVAHLIGGPVASTWK